MRRWEYALALRAYNTWVQCARARQMSSGPIYDVGGSGSPFWRMMGYVQIIDPKESDGLDLAHFLTEQRVMLGRAVFCLSVLEHVEDLDQFLYHLSCLVAPGGLLFLTMDCWNQIGPDTAHFHWDRKRIFYFGDSRTRDPLHAEFYSPNSFALVRDTLIGQQFASFGGNDLAYHGHQLFGSYSFASLALIKRA
jgi:hypothetical protein